MIKLNELQIICCQRDCEFHSERKNKDCMWLLIDIDRRNKKQGMIHIWCGNYKRKEIKDVVKVSGCRRNIK